MFTKTFSHWLHQMFRLAGHDVTRVGLEKDYLAYSAGHKKVRTPLMALEAATYWEHVRSTLQSHPVKLVIDAGANEGQFATGLRQIGFSGHVASFEPNPAIAERLRERSKGDGSWSVHEIALGDDDREACLHVSEATTLSSCRAPSDFGIERFGKAIESVCELPVRIERLESVLGRELQRFRNQPTFLKLDAQGSDIEVYRGMGEHQSQIELLQIEMSFRPIYDGVPGFLDTWEYFRAEGFKPNGFFPVCIDPNTKELIEVDCIMFRSPTASHQTNHTAAMNGSVSS